MPKKTKKRMIARRIILYEMTAFLFVIGIVWFDELLDIPSRLLGADPTPVNWKESLFESVFILILGALILRVTAGVLQKMKYLEGMPPVCASCKKIRDDSGAWRQIEEYVRERSDADFSHGICPECAGKLYPEFDPYRREGKNGTTFEQDDREVRK